MSEILIQTKIQSLVFNKYQNVVCVSHYKNDVLVNTFYLNSQLFKNIQLTLMYFRDALTRIRSYHDPRLARLFPELSPVKNIKNSPTVTTDNKKLGVVYSEGDALSFTPDELSILFILINTEIDLASTPETLFNLENLLSIKNKLVALDNSGG